jgi:hypothetical protein
LHSSEKGTLAAPVGSRGARGFKRSRPSPVGPAQKANFARLDGRAALR